MAHIRQFSRHSNPPPPLPGSPGVTQRTRCQLFPGYAMEMAQAHRNVAQPRAITGANVIVLPRIRKWNVTFGNSFEMMKVRLLTSRYVPSSTCSPFQSREPNFLSFVKKCECLRVTAPLHGLAGLAI